MIEDRIGGVMGKQNVKARELSMERKRNSLRERSLLPPKWRVVSG